ncbi:nicotinamide mononucleotide adenylyltransferas-like protein [Amylocarpus encephaloides]|uniref:Nicotinamide-nucleotide adenylyltransferase n=1 Tax=Amylocarpus encephaloides TaxID=45428 RepID=A0A9P7Y917_9HELO|nr:nicotinamide mononucleotide adenylyltransferas-like protein [Amylocarpus encephaloides]
MNTNLPMQSASAQTIDTYSFPRHRLNLTQSDPSKTPLILIACGSFSPLTYLHLRMFEMAADFAKFNTDFEILGGYLSPVSSAYKKAGLAPAVHRLRMCELGVDQTSNWLMVDPWEAIQNEYVPTAQVLDHFEEEINKSLGGAERPDGTRAHVQIALLAGADLIQTMSTPGVWSEKDLDHILGRYGTFIIERTGTDIDDALANLQPYKDKIYVIQQLIQNNVSSTKIRLFLRREMSVQYLIPAPVIEYIEEHGLYEEDGASSIDGRGKGKDASAGPSGGEKTASKS